VEGFIFFVIVAVAVVVIIAARGHRQRIAATWASAARSLGMEIQLGSTFRNPKIEGRVDDLGVTVDTYTRGSGNNSQTYTRFRVRYPSVGIDFDLSRQTGLSTITKLFGAQDVEIGDPTFDDTFTIKSDQPGRLAAVLTPTRRTTILNLAASFPGVNVTNGAIRWDRRGVVTDPGVIVTVVRRLIGAAYVMIDRDGAATGLDAAIEARNEGDLETTTERIRQLGDSFRDLVEIRRIEAETLAEAGEPEAAGMLAELAEELPDDDEIRGWRDRVGAESPAPAPATPPAIDIADAGPSGLAADAIAADLFGESRLSFETSRRFDERYAGTVVQWSGSVRSTREYRRDPKLGDAPGTRVVVSVARIENDLYGQTTVDAVVGLPAGNANTLRGRDEVTFQGTLVGVDAMMRNLFVGGARLV
jgi:hypothetical protein